MAFGLTAALLASILTLLAAPAPAGAATVTTTASLTLNCTANAPIVGAQQVTQALSIDIDHPDAIPRNTIEHVAISQPPLTVPTEVSGYPMIHLRNLSVALKVPSQFRIESAVTVGGDTPASVSYTVTGDAILSIPGPLLPGVTYQLPALDIALKAVGTPGTTGNFFFSSFNLTARASLPLVGASDIPTSCPTPVPNPALFGIGVAPGAFSTTPETVTNTANLSQGSIVKYGGTTVPSAGATTANPFSISTTGYKDVPPGTTTDVAVDLGSRDWLSPFRVGPHQTYSAGLITSGRNIQWMQNWTMSLNGPNPSVFQVLNVTSANPSAMTAAYNPATNVIVLARPTGAAGQFLPDTTFVPPRVTVSVKAVGPAPYPKTATLSYRSMAFNIGYQTITCFIGCFPGGTTTAVATGTGPAGQPNTSVLNVAPSPAPTIGSIGIVEVPGTSPDVASVANNEPGVEIPVLANDTPGTYPFDPASVFIVDEPSSGTATVDPVTGVVFYAPEYGTLSKQDGFTYVVQDSQGRYSNISSVVINIQGIFCYGPCSLDQVIEVTVDGAALSMSQTSGSVELDTVTLDGDAKYTSGALNEVTVVNRRGDGAPWSVTGQLTRDFTEDPSSPECPASDPTTWNYRCIPGENLGWDPMSQVDHAQVPGDVATIGDGATLSNGLRSSAKSLCSTASTTSGGTFRCGAILTLGVPASAAAQRYGATLTITLA